MTMITKQIAGLLYGFSYQLQDNEGNVWDISELSNSERMILKSTKPKKKGNHLWETIFYSEIGSTYKILARPVEHLTKEIEGVGIPIVELAKIESRTIENSDKYTYNFEAFKRGLNFDSYTPCVRWFQYHANKLEDHTDSTHYEMQLYSLKPLRIIKKTTYKPNYIGSPWYSNSVFNQQMMEEKLRELHFNLDFPEGTTTKLI